MTKPLALGIFGYPIGHTLSPLMHTIAAEANGLSASYSAYEVRPERLEQAVRSIPALGIDGVNVTVPHKVAVMEHLDEVTDEARFIGAVNTIVNDGGDLIGYNTDGYGFITSLTYSAGEDVTGAAVFVYGAGGAARAVVHALADAGAGSIVIANRDAGKAAELAARTGASFPSCRVEGIGLDEIPSPRIEGADIIVNTTSVGMEGVDQRELPGVEAIRRGALAVDIVYRPLETPFLKTARGRGARTLDGLWMLIHQGAKAFRLWTGKRFPVDEVREAALAALRDRRQEP